MDLILRDGWPYLPPLVEVEGVRSWHADHDRLCLWQEGDGSRQWITFQGILHRIDEWATGAANGFGAAGAALDAWLHFDTRSSWIAALDLREVMPQPRDGASFPISAAAVTPALWFVGRGWTPESSSYGRLMYRSRIAVPPRTLDDVLDILTSAQRRALAANLTTLAKGKPAWNLVGVAWETEYGTDLLLLQLTAENGRVSAGAVQVTPVSEESLVRRAGPDATTLRSKHVCVLGCGAIGSHVIELLARSGVGHIKAVDGQVLLPVNLVRHAGGQNSVGRAKAYAAEDAAQPWTWSRVEPLAINSWSPLEIEQLIDSCDLVIEATGLTPYSELVGRVAAGKGVPLITAALYRGGAIGRVRRQASSDITLDLRRANWLYPRIPKAANEDEDLLGTELGCAAAVINAPPVSVTSVAALTANLAIDSLCERRRHPDEVIEVYCPIEAPFDMVGTWKPEVRPHQIYVTEEVQWELRAAATVARPNETGGILLGFHTEDGPWITHMVELAADHPSRTRYVVPAAKTHAAVQGAATNWPGIGYLGEWHSHPANEPASLTDATTMALLAQSAHPLARPILIVVRGDQAPLSVDAFIAHPGGLENHRIQLTGPLLEDAARRAHRLSGET